MDRGLYASSFVVRLWIEETAEEAGTATWRGHITHVPSGDRRYIKELCEILPFISPYLEEMGVSLNNAGAQKKA